MKLLFINPTPMPYKEVEDLLTNFSILRIPTFRMPLGIIELGAYVRREISDLDITILDMAKDLYDVFLLKDKRPQLSVEEFIQAELDKIDFEPDIVGMSIMFTAAHNFSVVAINQAKQKWSKAKIICGGMHTSNFVPQLLSNPNVDYVVRGEAEYSLTEYIKEIKKGNSAPDVCGFIDREKLKTDPCQNSPMMQNLDELPLPAYDLLDLESYRKTSGACLMWSRGCPFKCTFCTSFTVHTRQMRYKSTELILKNFEYLYEKCDFQKINIEDDLFAANRKTFMTISKKVGQLGYDVEYGLPNGLSVNVFTEELIDGLGEMGVREIKFAIESGSPYTQRHIIKKNAKLPKAIQLLKYMREKDYVSKANFILGFPGETKELMHESISYMKTLDVDWVYIFNAIPLPGSEMLEQLTAAGVTRLEDLDLDGMRLGERTFDTPEISAIDLKNLVYDTNIEINFFNNSNMRHGRYQRAADLFTELIIESYPFNIVGTYCRGLAYMRMGQREKGIADFKECVKWIHTNDESKRLYDRYGTRMPELTPYFSSVTEMLVA